MLSSRAGLAFLVAAAVVAAPAFATPTHKKSSTPHARTARTSTHAAKANAKGRKGSKKSRKTKLRGQQGIDSARATEIQQALIREHYLTGEPTGQWDSNTVSAMQKFQGDQGWQTRLTPDSRALKKLGLGPDYSNAINASGSSFVDPKAAGELPAAQSAGFEAASGVNR
jgi:peptidoglycan hydrolase-like protein with peptidoglycan-binding domain